MCYETLHRSKRGYSHRIPKSKLCCRGTPVKRFAPSLPPPCLSRMSPIIHHPPVFVHARPSGEILPHPCSSAPILPPPKLKPCPFGRCLFCYKRHFGSFTKSFAPALSLLSLVMPRSCPFFFFRSFFHFAGESLFFFS